MATTVQLQLFGAPAVVQGGRSLALPCERRVQLAVYLALKRGWVGRAELAGLLWPEQDVQRAYTNLRKALHRLQGVAWAAGLESHGSALRFEADTDVQDFERALQAHRAAEALTLYREPLLAGFEDHGNEAWSSWLNFERERLRGSWCGAVRQRLDEDPAPAEGVELALRLLEADPLDDGALRLAMIWLARAGQTARARQVYSTFVTRLADDLGLEPSAELKALHDTLGSVASTARAAATPADEGFIGRTVELRRIAALLAQEDCRLLTVIGPGGVGKTRLAQRVVAECAGDFAGGAVFVALDDLTAAAELCGRLARELDIELKGGAEPFDQVVAALRGRSALLVLDNFEQLTESAPQLDRMLGACLGVKAVVTSRVRLGLPSEWLVPIDGLPCPDEEDLDHLEAFDAVRLFVRGARRVRPDFSSASEAAGLVDICRQVDGLPLALELAAAWTRVLSCADIASELHRGTELLQAVDPSKPARHASIEVVFEQSWQLLTAAERDVLAKLSVFHGSFSPEAARTVAAAALPVLGALADKSLLHREGTRLRLHPLVQQFAAARLTQGGVRGASAAAHAAHYLRWLAQLRVAASHAERSALRAIDLEFENVRRAWHAAVELGKTDFLSQATTSLSDYCDHRGRSAEGLALLRRAMQASAVQADGPLHALLLSKAAHLEYRLDRYAEAEAHARAALAATRRGQDEVTRLQALNVLGTCAFRLGRLVEARRHFEDLLALGSTVDPTGLAANTMDHLALIEKAEGRYDEALRLSLKALVAYRRSGDSAEEALCLNNLGSLQVLLGDTAAAQAHLREALSLCERDALAGTLGFVLTNLTEVATRHGELVEAQALARRAIQAATSSGNRAVAAWALIKAARLAALRCEPETARRMLAEASTEVLAMGVLSLKFDALSCLAQILVVQGESACSEAVMRFAIKHPLATAAMREEATVRLALMRIEPLPSLSWPSIELDDLLQRLVAEADLAYAPLIAELRAR